MKLCGYYNEQEGTCGSNDRRKADMRNVFGKSPTHLVRILCDYDKNHEVMSQCSFSKKEQQP